MDYLKVLKESLSIWWKNKFLWILGFIAVIFGGNGGNSFSYSTNQNLGSNSNSNNSFNEIINSDNFRAIIDSIYKFLTSPLGMVLIVVSIIFIILIVLICMYFKSRADASLISATSLLSQNKDITFKQAWGLSKNNWNKIFWLNILINLPLLLLNLIFVIFVVIGITLFFRSLPSSSGGIKNIDLASISSLLILFGIISFLVCCFTIIYSTVAKIVASFAYRIAVLKDKKVIESIKLSWNFIKGNFAHLLVFWLLSVAWGLILVIISFVLLILIIPAGLIIIPILLINWVLGILLIILLFIGLGLLSLAISGPIYSFGEVYWTKVYLELTKSNA
jgi:hypothetical protein